MGFSCAGTVGNAGRGGEFHRFSCCCGWSPQAAEPRKGEQRLTRRPTFGIRGVPSIPDHPMRFLKRLAIGLVAARRDIRRRGLVSAGRLPPHPLDRDRGAGRANLPARQRSAPMGGLVALGEARPERQGDVLRSAVRSGRFVQMGRQRQDRRRHDDDHGEQAEPARRDAHRFREAVRRDQQCGLRLLADRRARPT